MKKVFFLLCISFVLYSCDSLNELLELNVNNDLTENIDVSVQQTNGTAEAFDLSETTDLNSGDLAEYKGKIKAIKINKFTYKFKSFTGNAAGTIPTGTLKFDDVVVDIMKNFNVSQAATAGTIFEIDDASILSKIEQAFLNNNTATIKLFGNVLSDAGNMNFTVEVFMNLTATIKD